MERTATLRHGSREGSQQALIINDATEDDSAGGTHRSDGSELHHTTYSKRDAVSSPDRRRYQEHVRRHAERQVALAEQLVLPRLRETMPSSFALLLLVRAACVVHFVARFHLSILCSRIRLAARQLHANGRSCPVPVLPEPCCLTEHLIRAGEFGVSGAASR